MSTEPEVSKWTITKRKFQYPIFVIGLFFISLLGLACGEPTDRVYMCNIYGHRYADIYECLSRWSDGPRSTINIIFRVVFHIVYWAASFLGAIILCIFLFAQLVVKTIGWVLMITAATPGWSLRKCAAFLEWVFVQTLDAVGLVFSLQWKTWAIAIPACWMLYVELRQMVGTVS